MSAVAPDFVDALAQRFEGAPIGAPRGETTLEIPPAQWLDACRALRDEFGFDTFIDLCGVDYLSYGSDEWDTHRVTVEGFSRGVEGKGPGRFKWGEQPSHQVAEPDAVVVDSLEGKRYAVVLHLLSGQHNRRLACALLRRQQPAGGGVVTSLCPCANVSSARLSTCSGSSSRASDLRRILPDYGFVGPPFRHDSR